MNTLDGKLSALNYNSQGKEVWSIDTGPGSMLSSNIDQLEVCIYCKVIAFEKHEISH